MPPPGRSGAARRHLVRKGMGGRLSGRAAGAPPAAAEGRSSRSRPGPAGVRAGGGRFSSLRRQEAGP